LYKAISWALIATFTLFATTSCSRLVGVRTEPKAFTSFEIPGVSFGSSIGESHISITTLKQDSLNNLIARFTTTGVKVDLAGVKQKSGETPNDFSAPLVYTVTGRDGRKQNYVVTLNIRDAVEHPTVHTTSNIDWFTANVKLHDSNEVVQDIPMRYVQNRESIIIPRGRDDSGRATIHTRFLIGQYEITNAQGAAVFNWAAKNNKFDSPHPPASGIPEFGGQPLFNSNQFTATPSGGYYETTRAQSSHRHPMQHLSWYGAIMFCNWLTEMRDGHTGNVVYSGMSSNWNHNDTRADISKSGYRLPTSEEWEYAARYRGTETTNTVDGFTNPYFTKGDSPSHAVTGNTEIHVHAVAVLGLSSPLSVGRKRANTLGLSDMSGNVSEWCFTRASNDRRIHRGGSFSDSWDSDRLRIGVKSHALPADTSMEKGLRLCRTVR